MIIDAAFTRFPSLTTQRLQLRQLQPTDTEVLFALKSDPLVTALYGQEPHRSLEDTHTLLQRLQNLYERREGIHWGITFKDTDTIIGLCMLFRFDPDAQYAEAGYELHRAYWRQGIVSEAMSSLITYGFTELGLHRIEANVGAGNIPSQNLLLKLGFSREGILRQRYFFRGQFEDQHCFGLLKDDFSRVIC